MEVEFASFRSDARVAEGGALLRRYTGLNPYREFESLSLRQTRVVGYPAVRFRRRALLRHSHARRLCAGNRYFNGGNTMKKTLVVAIASAFVLSGCAGMQGDGARVQCDIGPITVS